MSGLNPEKHELLEIAVLITDGNLNILEEKGFERVIHHPEYILNSMDAWCKKNHEKSGLIQSVLSSPHTLASTELELLEYLQKYVSKPKVAILAGNSVYVDRAFLFRYIPRIVEYLHYRVIDVSTIKELARRWNYYVFQNAPKKKANHRAMDDIRESIEELRYYKKTWLI
ncbi:unnamed protein product [Pneumocystis jirovecii]|uniref:Exonuclease domain-containing protein n=2 Tax=Pneumocystis jirovecii TaxID=42068 RepID=L0P9G8_PNEJI|nr:uncharacterized protein T551_02425 [Pneumocystis jirovecii RU7]KTW29151.1 hypothetical protein T551_02425 [Pneumocystis jirovecii RU7]CCJ28270.1 unnamed protein product [Pneumocystis jirovecii]